MKIATNTNRFETTRAFFAMLAIIALLAAPFAPLRANANAVNVVDNVTVCHYDSGKGGKYTSNNVSINSSGALQGGHDGHDNDIIPPFDYDNGDGVSHYDGKNWDTAGQATWNNDCVVPTPVVVDVCPNIQGDQATVPEGMVLDDGQCVTAPTSSTSTLKVHIYKYLKTASTTAQVPNAAGIQSFPMISSWSATNIGSGSGSYVLGNNEGGTALQYAADTSAMSAPADYTTSEVTGGDSTVLSPGAECVEGKYRLVGYKAGDSVSAAEAASLSTTAPVYTGLTADKYVIVVNEKCAPVVSTPKTCTVVSDEATLLGTSTAGAALAWVHPAWDTTLSAGTAKWIWTTSDVTNPSVSETATFTKYFNVDVAPAGATLKVSADNSYTVSLNGTPLSCDGSGSSNFSSVDTCSAPVVAGINTLTFTATNDGVVGETNPHNNPAGLIYELDIDGSSCSPVPKDECINIDGLQTSVPRGYEANSDHICTPVVETPFCKVGSNLLQNASFETPVAPTNGWNIFATVANWTISNDGLEIWNKFMGTGAGLASAGDQNAELDGNSPSAISQTIATVPGATYELRYDFSPRAGTNLANNSVAAQADGVTVDSASADGSTNAGNVWTTHTKTFVATSTNTTITFKDLGTADSLGTLIDNTGVCFVAAPVPSCNVTVVSDTSNTVDEKGGAAAKLVTFIHGSWTTAVSGASWIWGDDPVVDPVGTTTQTITKTFVWNGGVGSTMLELAADNSYDITLNGTSIASNTTEFNYGAVTTLTGFNAAVHNGVNTLKIKVKNFAMAGGTVTSNPAGALYKLTITGSDESCDIVPPPAKTSEVTMCKVDQNQHPLSGWTLTLNKGGMIYDLIAHFIQIDEPDYSATTSENGCVTFKDVPYGTYTKGEIMKAGWTNVSGLGAGVVDSATEHFDIVNKKTTGNIEITKYLCPSDTSILRSNNGVGGTVPAACHLQDGATFGYVHGTQSDANGPYPELGAPLTAAGTTTGGDLIIPNLDTDGRYLVVETNTSNQQIPAGDILGLFCTGDGDTSNTNDNQELTFVSAGNTTHCVAYNKMQPQGGGDGEGQPTFTSQIVVVKAADLAANIGDVIASTTKWFFYNDETDVIDNTLGSFVTGPATAPIGVGSAQMSVTGTQRRNIATYQFKDVKLADIKKLNFSTYSQSVGDGSPATGRAPYLNFNVDFNNTDTWQKRLVYVPATNGTVVADTWQTWNAASGTALWTWSGFAANGNKWPDNNTNVNRTWNDIVASFPNIQTRSTDSWFGFRVGEPYNNGFTGNVDDFVIAIKTGLNTHTKTTDFEPNTVTLTVTTSGDGHGIVTSSPNISCSSDVADNVETCVHTYPVGTPVTLAATPFEGSNFDSTWAVGAGTCTGNTTPCTVTMNTDTALTAHFGLNTPSTGGGGGGGGTSNATSRSGNHHPTDGSSSGNGEVLGASTSNLPSGEVLGAVAPVGAPNTGEGGADTDTTANALTALFVALLGLGLLVAPKRA